MLNSIPFLFLLATLTPRSIESYLEEKDPSTALLRSIEINRALTPEGKYGLPDKYDMHAWGIPATAREIEEDIEYAEYQLVRGTKAVDVMMDIRQSDIRRGMAEHIRYCDRYICEWMSRLQTAIASAGELGQAYQPEFERLDRLYDAIMEENQNPRYLSVEDRRSWFRFINERRRSVLDNRGFSNVCAIDTANNRPFSLAYELQKNGIISSTREAIGLALLNSVIQDEQGKPKVDVYLLREKA